MKSPKRQPFTTDEWIRWRDSCLAAEASIRELSVYAGVAYGGNAEIRGRRRARDLASFREFVEMMTCGAITDENQLELFLGTTEAWS